VYNVFKRPMFKLGGQADQGTGIMSTVEPRQNYMFGNVAQPLTPFQNTYTELPAYAYGGRIGYAQAGPVQVPDPFNYFAPSNIPKAGVPQVQTESGESILRRNQAAFDKEVRRLNAGETQGIPSISKPQIKGTPFFARSAQEQELYDRGYLTEDMTPAEKNRALQNLKLARGATREEDVATIKETKVISKKPVTKEAEDTDPREEIRKEAAVLKDLLKDEGLTTAENAFIIAKALSTPGGFNAKIAAAANLAMPIIKERSKLDRDLVLKAYERTGELEKARIAAGKKDPAAQLEQDIVNTKIRQATTSGDVAIGEDGITRYKTPGSDKFRTVDEIRAEVQTIRVMGPKYVGDVTNAIRELEVRIQKEKAQKSPNLEAIKKSERDLESLQRQLKGGFATGGRVKKQFGGMMDTTEEATEVEETSKIIDTNVAGTPMKPVQKLTYEEIRSRLPQEITNDIVQLLANSAEALQDFAYIKTQQDVNQFNVKYGVNLVLPQGT
jgi:translation initiation factor 1 (eIF-1/SUI1)